MNKELRENLLNIINQGHKKEYVCHVQYVVEIGLRLAKEYSVDQDVIEVACLLHDIGRHNELPGEEHEQAGKRMAEEILADSNFSREQKQKIFSCIESHASKEIPESLEEKIVRSADAGSKIEYHEAFMLMCKKEIYDTRLAWGIKYLEKGHDYICLESYKKTVESKYLAIKKIYQQVLNSI